MNIKELDWNLLPVLSALLESGSVSKAAERLHITQPAASNALKRLRAHFDDPIFVRKGRGLVPTPLALEIATKLRSAIEAVESLSAAKEKFVLADADAKITIAATDYFEVLFAPKLLHSIQTSCPAVKVIFRPNAGHLPVDDLENGKVDIAVGGFFRSVPEECFQTILLQDDFCVARKRRSTNRSLSMQNYLKEKHLLVSTQGELKGLSDEALDRLGKKREIIAGTMSFLSPVFILLHTDSAITAPRRILELYRKWFPIQISELPLKVDKVIIRQVWHRRTEKDPLRAWLRDEIERIAGSLK